MELLEAYNAVKNHKFRNGNNPAYLRSYQSALENLSNAWWHAIKDHEKYSDATNMIHDFNMCAWRIGLKNCDYAFLHVEKCIGIIHYFLDTGEVPRYFTYARSSNIPIALSGNREYVYVEKHNRYFLNLTKERRDMALKEVETRRDALKKNGKKIVDWGPFGNKMYNFLKNYKTIEEL